MTFAIIIVLIIAIVLGLSQSRNKKKLRNNPNDRTALINLFDACDAPSTYEDAAEYGIKYLENNPNDYEIMHYCAKGFVKTESGPGLRKLLDERISNLVTIVDDPIQMQDFMKKDKNFRIYAHNLFTYYAATLTAFKETEKAQFYESKAKSLK